MVYSVNSTFKLNKSSHTHLILVFFTIHLITILTSIFSVVTLLRSFVCRVFRLFVYFQKQERLHDKSTLVY